MFGTDGLAVKSNVACMWMEKNLEKKKQQFICRRFELLMNFLFKTNCLINKVLYI